MLTLADSFLDPNSKDQSLTERKKKWLGYMVLNVVFLDFHGASKGLLDKGTIKALESFLGYSMRDETIYNLTQSGGAYSPEFQSFCRSIRERIEKSQIPSGIPTIASEEVEREIVVARGLRPNAVASADQKAALPGR
ncbi:MAG: hypothetical protein ACJ75H_21745 [Thermoanaerobaculia bacterium]